MNPASKSPPTLFVNAQLVDPQQAPTTTEPGSLLSNAGVVCSPRTHFFSSEEQPTVVDCQGKHLTPGFIDVQINGSHGCDYSKEPTLESIEHSRRSLLKTGCTSHCPTLVSLTSPEYRSLLPLLTSPTPGCSDNLGLHLEGPHFCPEKKGAHLLPNICDPSDFGGWKDMVGPEWDKVKIVTLAPELPNSLGLISSLSSHSIIPSMGHTSCTYDQGLSALSQGAGLITHLYNAMSPFHHRQPSLVGLSSSMPFSIISDGVHVHPAAVNLAFQGNKSGCILVTDAMAAMGLPDGEYTLGSMEVTKGEGKATLKGTDTLAGSVASIDECLAKFLSFTSCSIEEGVACVTTNPARLLGLSGKKGTLAVGSDADLVLWGDGVERVWKSGVEVQ
mmetsp:Transcript_7690/g.15321  ORF Transcript_7690/g.15321 Transcript_7690/m.15321 type:complete len:388 (+) Transcript_7690:119-1282(+)